MNADRFVEHAVRDDSTPSEAVLHAVAEAERTEPYALDPPLYSAVEPDALDELVGSLGEGIGRVEFTYLGYEIRFRTAESFLIRPQNADEAPNRR